MTKLAFFFIRKYNIIYLNAFGFVVLVDTHFFGANV